MNILSVNKYFFPKGGAETYYFSLNSLLKDKGYQVTTFSMKDQRNRPSSFENYFVESIDYNKTNILKKMQYTAKLIYSLEAKKKIGRLIRDSNPSLAHLQNFYHQLSPSILKEIKKYHLPVVFTAHDLKLLCPNYQMLCRGEICEKCKEHHYIQCALNRCMKDSTAASLVSMTEMYLHHMLKSFDNIDVIITPSVFFRNKFIEFGFSPDKIVHIPNFVEVQQYKPNYCSKGYAVYFGRLSREKGVLTLVKAMKGLKNIDLYIAGDGPMKPVIEKNIEEAGMKNVKLLGFKTGDELAALIQNCYLTVLPSECYENAPMSVLEAMACGKPVIGADIGGIPELVQHGRTGYVFEPKNSQQLSEQLNDLYTNPQKAIDMGLEARRRVEERFGREEHFEKIDGIYNKLLMCR